MTPRHDFSTLLWEYGRVSCYSVTRRLDDLDIILMEGDAVIERRTFTNTRDAADFAVEKMNEYEARTRSAS